MIQQKLWRVFRDNQNPTFSDNQRHIVW